MFGWIQAKRMDVILPQVEFSYNNSINRSTSNSPFQIVYENSPRTTSELRKLDKGEMISAEVEKFAEHLKNIHEEVRQYIIKMNGQYKAKANEGGIRNFRLEMKS